MLLPTTFSPVSDADGIYVCSAVSDADGDIVRCRWADLAQEECAGVCEVFPATLDQVGCTLLATVNVV